MSLLALAAILTFAVVGVAWACAFYERSRYHSAKAEVYREFAETFGAMVPMHHIRDSAERKRESQRRHMRLALVDPWIRDGLRAALEEADEHWGADQWRGAA